jgi:putative ABC transport system permease protein
MVAPGIVRESLRTVWRFRLRSILTIISAMLGVAGVVSSVNYAAAGREQVLEQIRKMGTNLITVTPLQNRSVGGRARTGSISTTLVDADYTAIRRAQSGIRRSSAISSGRFKLKAGEFSKDCSIIGCEPDYPAIKNWPVLEGAFFDSSDDRRLARVAVLGRTVARDLFGDDSSVGKHLLINRVPFEIVGVMAERGQGVDLTNEDDQVYIPLRTAMRRLMNLDYYSAFVFETDRWQDMDANAAVIGESIRQRHSVSGNRRDDDFQVQNQKSLIDNQIASARTLRFFVQWIGISGLIVSGAGALAIHWIAVKQRTVELGTRRAIGASASNIFLQVLVEVVAITSTGSVLGLAVAWQASKSIAAGTRLPQVFDSSNALFVLAVSLALNIIFSLLPSGRAARLDPISALKYE